MVTWTWRTARCIIIKWSFQPQIAYGTNKPDYMFMLFLPMGYAVNVKVLDLFSQVFALLGALWLFRIQLVGRIVWLKILLILYKVTIGKNVCLLATDPHNFLTFPIIGKLTMTFLCWQVVSDWLLFEWNTFLGTRRSVHVTRSSGGITHLFSNISRQRQRELLKPKGCSYQF